MDFHIPSLIIVLTLILLFGVAFNVGKARAKNKVNAPATTGHLKFELAYRVQMNTVEKCCGALHFGYFLIMLVRHGVVF